MKSIYSTILIILAFFIITKDTSTEVFSDGIALPVLMYHSILEQSDKKYIISTENFEKDLIYLVENGYSSVTCKDLIKYTDGTDTLPEKPVMITFDDGMLNNMTFALPLLEKYGFSAVFSIVGSYADEYSENNVKNPKYSYINWQDLSSLCENPHIELANHSYNLHSISNRYGPQRQKNESFSEYHNVFWTDTKKMQQEFMLHCRFSPVIYTYPFGGFCSDSEKILQKNGFLVTFSCVEGINKITNNPKCLYLLKRYNRDGRLSTAEFFKKIGI